MWLSSQSWRVASHFGFRFGFTSRRKKTFRIFTLILHYMKSRTAPVRPWSPITHVHTHTHTQAHTRTHTHTHTHMHAQTHARTYTHTNKQMLSLYLKKTLPILLHTCSLTFPHSFSFLFSHSFYLIQSHFYSKYLSLSQLVFFHLSLSCTLLKYFPLYVSPSISLSHQAVFT